MFQQIFSTWVRNRSGLSVTNTHSKKYLKRVRLQSRKNVFCYDRGTRGLKNGVLNGEYHC